MLDADGFALAFSRTLWLLAVFEVTSIWKIKLGDTDSIQLGFTTVPAEKPVLAKPAPIDDATSEATKAEDVVLRDLHTILIRTEVCEGKMICGNCGHEYKIKEGIANFLLPSHLGGKFLAPVL